MFGAKLATASAVVRPSSTPTGGERGESGRMSRFEESKKYQEYHRKTVLLKEQTLKKSNKVKNSTIPEEDEENGGKSGQNRDSTFTYGLNSMTRLDENVSSENQFLYHAEEEAEDTRLSCCERITGMLANGRFQARLQSLNIFVKILAALFYILRIYHEGIQHRTTGDYKNCWANEGFYLGSQGPTNLTENNNARLTDEIGDQVEHIGDVLYNLFTATGLNSTWATISSYEFLDFESVPDEDKGPAINPNWNGNGDFNWEVIAFVCRLDSLYFIQVGLAMFNMAYFIFYYMLLYHFYDRSHVIDLLRKNSKMLLIEMVNTFPFLLAFFGFKLMKYIWVPIFMNIWLVKEEIKEAFINTGKISTATVKMTIMFEIFCNVFTTALFINHLERAGKYPNHFNILNSFWFIFVTVMTVGYGDIVPTTWLSKCMMMVMFYLLYMSLVKSYSQYLAINQEEEATGGQYVHNTGENGGAQSTDFVIFCTTEYSEDITADFMNEFYSVEENRHLRVVILNAADKTPDIVRSVDQLKHENEVSPNQVNYYKGSLILETDLERISAKYAKACFIVTHRSSADALQQDQRTVMRAMHLKSYAPNVKIYVHLLKIQSKLHVEFADCITCDEELNHAMFALNCRIPGISTAMVCMCHTTQGKEEDDDFEVWEKHINKSVDFEIYDREVMKSRIFQHFLGQSFTFTSYHCYTSCAVNLIGVSRDNRMMINPGSNFILREDDIMYYISEFDEDEMQDLSYLARKSFHHSSTDQNENIEATPIVHVKNSSRPMKANNTEFDIHTLDEDDHNETDLIREKPTFLVDFPPFCPVIDRCALHVICYLTGNYANDINTVREKTIYRSEVFGKNKNKHANSRKPIIIISEAKLTMSIFNLITHLRAVHNTQGTFENPLLNPIIFLTPGRPDDAILRGIHRFPEIYYHLGVCTNVEDLLYINALNAEVLIYFNEPPAQQVIEQHNQLQEILFDRSQIINILHLEHLFPKIRLLACLTFSGNLKFLESDPEAIVASEFGNAMFHSRKSQEMLMSQLSAQNDDMAKTMNRRLSMAPMGSLSAGRGNSLSQRMNQHNDSLNEIGLSPSFVDRLRDNMPDFTESNPELETGKKDIEHNHLRYLFKESFASGKSFTMSMFDTLLYQSFNKPYLPELLKLMLGLTYSISSGKLSIYRISHHKDVGITYDQLYKKLCGADQCDRPGTREQAGQGRGFLSTNSKAGNANKSVAQFNSLHGFSGTGVPIGLYRTRPNLRASMNQEAARQNKQHSKSNNRQTRIKSRNFDAILAAESQKSERQLVDEYLEKRTKELFGDNEERVTNETNSFGGAGGWDVNSGYIILSPDKSLPMCKGDIVYVLKAHENIEEAMHP